MATRPAIFKWRQTEPVVVLCAVRWYCDTHCRFETSKSCSKIAGFVREEGRWCYLYWAIDSAGATIDFLFSVLRDADAAKRLFRKALSDRSHPQPGVINTKTPGEHKARISRVPGGQTNDSSARGDKHDSERAS